MSAVSLFSMLKPSNSDKRKVDSNGKISFLSNLFYLLRLKFVINQISCRFIQNHLHASNGYTG